MTCKDCIHDGICIWTQVDSKNKKVCKDFKNKADFISKWISTKDRLPEADERMVEIVAFIAGAQKSTTLYFLNGEFFDDNNDYYNVVCWQPLPEPPKQEELLR